MYILQKRKTVSSFPKKYIFVIFNKIKNGEKIGRLRQYLVDTEL